MNSCRRPARPRWLDRSICPDEWLAALRQEPPALPTGVSSEDAGPQIWRIFEAAERASALSRQPWVQRAWQAFGDSLGAERLGDHVRQWARAGRYRRAQQGIAWLAGLSKDLGLWELARLRLADVPAFVRNETSQCLQQHPNWREALERSVPTGGVQADGSLCVRISGRKVTLRVDDELRLVAFDDVGRVLSRPAAGPEDGGKRQWQFLRRLVEHLPAWAASWWEEAMIEQRRWPSQHWQRCFVDHPLLQRLARRVLWGWYGDGGLNRCFRLCEDYTLADHADQQWLLPSEGSVGVAHRLEIPAEHVEPWQVLWRDYQLWPLFDQLTRRVARPTSSEQAGTSVRRFVGRTVSGQWLRRLLTEHGWQAGPRISRGRCQCHYRRFPPAAVTAWLEHTPVWLRATERDYAARLGELRFAVASTNVQTPPQPEAWLSIAEVPAMVFSEACRSVDLCR